MPGSDQNELGLATALTPIWREFLAAGEAAQMLFVSSLELLFAEREDRGPALTIPGFLANELSMTGLFFSLSAKGHKMRTSGLGINWRCPEESAEIVAETEHKVYVEEGVALDLIGHSAGGYIACRTQQMNPSETRSVITITTPQNRKAGVHPWLIGIAKMRRRAARLRNSKCFTAECDCLLGQLMRNGLNPDLCIHSDTDGIVESEGTKHSDATRNRLVNGAAHSTAGMNLEVANIVIKELANGRRQLIN